MKDAGRGWKTQTKTRESGLTLENKKPKERETINTKKVDVRPHSVRPSQIFIIFTYKAAAGNKNKNSACTKTRAAYVFSYSRDTLHVRTKQFSRRFGMSGCLAPWSMTMPRTSFVSVCVLCIISMISTINRSRGLPSW